LQKKLDADAAKLVELKKDTAERKRKTQMQASSEKVAGVEAAVQKLAAVMAKFSDEKLDELSTEDACAVAQEMGAAERDAQMSVSDARKFLAMRLQETKSFSEAMRGPMAQDLSKMQSKLTQSQVELAKLSKQFSEREQRFVARNLVESAEAGLEDLQADTASATKVAAPLLADDQTEFVQAYYAQILAGVLQTYMQNTGTTLQVLFASITSNTTADAKEFVTFVLERLPEMLEGTKEAVAGSFSEEQAAAIFAYMSASQGKASATDFEAVVRERLVCLSTSGVPLIDALDEGQEIGSVEAGEAVHVLEEQQDKDGNKCARCVLARDSTTAWVILANSDGVINFRPSPSAIGRMDSIEAYVKAIHEHCTEAARMSDQKVSEVSNLKQGPLSEIKDKLIQARTKLSQEQSKIEQLKKSVASAKAQIVQRGKEDLQKVQQAKCKALAAKSVTDCTSAVEVAEAKADKVIESTKGANSESLQKEHSIPQIKNLKREADAALQALVDGKAVVARTLESFEVFKGHTRNFLEARVELTKLTARANVAEKRCSAATDAVRAAHTQVVRTATQQARSALRLAARKLGRSNDELFEELAKGLGEISEAAFIKFAKSLPEHGLASEQVSLVYNEFGPYGLKKLGFSKALQEFCRCDKEIAITDAFELGEHSSTVRKLKQHELFEVLEGPREDADSQLKRVRGRALKDAAAGWVTLKGNQGTPFLKETKKPFMHALREASLREKFDETSPLVRKLEIDEVVELLEGPRDWTAEPAVMLHVKASKDGVAGWVTLKDTGVTFASPSKSTYVCRSTIAMTDSFDIQNCNIVRKVGVGEALEVVASDDQAKPDTDKAITRLRFKAPRDGKEGWVTLKGNNGTIFVEMSKSHYVVDKDLPLRETITKGSALVRSLIIGEVLEALEPAKELKPEAKLGVKIRPLEDGKVGWVVVSLPAPVKPWTPKYTCKAAVAITGSFAEEGAAVVRQAEPGETFEAVDGPTVDVSTGLRRIRLATAADGVVGWATLRGSDGTAFLQSA
jgi:hypothetical protein